MTLLQRSLPSILCCVIAIGYAPAWLHVSVCHDHQATGFDVGKAGLSCLSVCGHAHVNQSQASHEAGLPDADEEHSEHDSETCFVCQSVGNANGMTLEWDTPLQSISSGDPTSIPNDFVFVGTSLSIAQPRGPPALV